MDKIIVAIILIAIMTMAGFPVHNTQCFSFPNIIIVFGCCLLYDWIRDKFDRE